MSTVPIFAPDGTLGDIPFEHMKAAIAAGGKLGVTVKAPTGELGVVPAERAQDAVKAGGSIVPFKEQETQHPGFWATAADDLKGLLHPSGFSPYPGMDQEQKSAAATQSAQQDQERKQAGYSLPYRALAPVAQAVGANVPGMEQSAKEGDVAGVGGHFAAAAAPIAAGEFLSQTAKPVAEATREGTAPARQALAEGTINKLIKPSRADVKFGKNPAGAIVNEGIVANSLEDLGDKVYAKAKEVGAQIDQTLQQPEAQGKTVDVSKSLQPIDDEIARAVKTGNKGLYDRLKELKQQLTMTWTEDAKSGSIAPVSAKKLQMTPYDATQFKREVGDLTRWTGNDPFEDDLNAVKAKVFGSIKDQVNQAVPGVADLNERYANLASAGKAIERRIPVAARNSEWSLGDVGTAMSAAHYGGPAAVAAVAGKKILGSTFFKTRLAKAIAGPTDVRTSATIPPAAVAETAPASPSAQTFLDHSSFDSAPIYETRYQGPVDIATIKAIKSNPELPADLRADAQYVYEAVVDSGMKIQDAMHLNGTDRLAKALGGRMEKTINAQR